MIASLVKNIGVIPSGFSSVTQKLWHLDPPLGGNEFVITSAAEVPFSGPETYIFGADSSGEVSEYSELEGSFRGGLDHEKAIRDAGYRVASENPAPFKKLVGVGKKKAKTKPAKKKVAKKKKIAKKARRK